MKTSKLFFVQPRVKYLGFSLPVTWENKAGLISAAREAGNSWKDGNWSAQACIRRNRQIWTWSSAPNLWRGWSRSTALKFWKSWNQKEYRILTRNKHETTFLPAVIWAVGFLYWRRAKVRACPRPWRPLTIPECAFWHFRWLPRDILPLF